MAAGYFLSLDTASPAVRFPVYLVGILVLIFGGTFLFTSCRFYLSLALRGKHPRKGQEPLTLPYWVPLIGSGISAIRDAESLYKFALSYSPGRSPIRLRMGSRHMYMIAGAENFQTVLRNSKELDFEIFGTEILQQGMGMPAQDAEKLILDSTGSNPTPIGPIPENGRIWITLHKVFHKYLSDSKAANFLANKFMGELSSRLNPLATEDWSSVTVLGLLHEKMFAASVNTLAGPNLMKNNPTFMKDFWVFDENFMRLIIGYPRLTIRKGWNARDRCIKATMKWLTDAWENYDWEKKEPDEIGWEENFGFSLFRVREEAQAKYGLSLEARAATELSVIWGLNTNATPITAHMLSEIIRDPVLLDQIRDEISTAVTCNPGSDNFEIDREALCSLPLLESIYKETLRFRGTGLFTRRLRNNIEVDGYTLRAGNFIIAPSRVAHMNESVWSTPEHPANTFWAQRFLPSPKGDKGEQSLSFKGGDFFPYGAGTYICPGRHLAKQEIMVAIAIMVTMFDFQVVGFEHLDGRPADHGPPCWDTSSRGVIPFDPDLRVKIRKRQVK